MTLLDHLHRHAIEHPPVPAIIHDGEVVTYADLSARVSEEAQRLRDEEHVQPGQLYQFVASQDVAYLVRFLALHEVGAICVPVDAIMDDLPDYHNPAVSDILFTTGSTPYNPYVKKKLRKVMLSDELGENGFLHERRHHIAHSFRQFTPEQLDYWAKNTRGLNYDDTLEAVANNRPHPLADPYNTCDPATGSWTERILTLRQYQDLVGPHQAKVSVRLGFYNSHRSGAKGFASRILNLLITMLHAKVLAPFIVLVIKK